jgi:hypothetical protein
MHSQTDFRLHRAGHQALSSADWRWPDFDPGDPKNRRQYARFHTRSSLSGRSQARAYNNNLWIQIQRLSAGISARHDAWKI